MLLLLLAGLWRLGLLQESPSLSRDGVTYCWLARDLATHGTAALRGPDFQQHPLYPAMIAATHVLLRAANQPDGPELWARAGQVVAFFAGMLVVLLTGRLAAAISHALALPQSRRGIELLAMAFAAVLPLNLWLSADAMSDMPHLAFYLASVLLLVRLETAWLALGCGLCSGLAFLVRPEGALVALVAVVVVAARRLPLRRAAVQGSAVLLGFLLMAAPYWIAAGKLTPKADKQTKEAFSATLADDGPALARLERINLEGYLAPGYAAYELFRAGRVVVPLLGLLAVAAMWREHRRSPAFWAPLACAAGHFGLTCILVTRHGYLDPRHLLVVVALLTPFAAFALVHGATWLRARYGLAATVAAIVAAILPLALYGQRVPNAADAGLAEIGRDLAQSDPAIATATFVGGASEKRIAFYAGLPGMVLWNENAADRDVSREDLIALLRDRRADYLVIETTPGGETAGNDVLLARLKADPRVQPFIDTIRRATAGPRTLEILRFDWSRPASGPVEG